MGSPDKRSLSVLDTFTLLMDACMDEKQTDRDTYPHAHTPSWTVCVCVCVCVRACVRACMCNVYYDLVLRLL